MLKHIREILKEVIEIFDNTTKEHESILSELEEKEYSNDKSNDKRNTNAESYKDNSNDKAKSLEDSNYFTEPSHYNPYRNNK